MLSVHLVQVDFQTRFPMYHLSCVCRQESRLSIPRGLGTITRGLGTWDNPELLAVSGSWKIPGIFQRIHFVMWFLNLFRKLIDFPVILVRFIYSQPLSSLNFSEANLFKFLPFPGEFQYELLGTLFLDSPILSGARFALQEFSCS